MNDAVFPPEVIEIIARKNVIAYTKLRECCRELAALLSISGEVSFYLRPTIVVCIDGGKQQMVSRPAITYTIAGRYIIKRALLVGVITGGKPITHIDIWLHGRKIISLRPKELKTTKQVIGAQLTQGIWHYPDTIELHNTPLRDVYKYYDRMNDGLICRLIVSYNKSESKMPTDWRVSYLMWFNHAYYKLSLDASGKVLEDVLQSTIPEYYAPNITPDHYQLE